jgi:nitronate monooxygenase
MTKAFSGKPARGIENQFIRTIRDYEDKLPGYPVQNTLTKGIRKAAAQQDKPEYMSLWSGQNPRGSRSIPAADIVKSIVKNMNEHA